MIAHKRWELELKFISHLQVINFPLLHIEELLAYVKGLAESFGYEYKN